MESDELIALLHDGNLTELALSVINEVLNSRGVTENQRAELIGEIETRDLVATSKPESRASIYSAEGFAAGLLSVAAYQFYFLPLLQLGGHLGRLPAAIIIGAVALVTMLGALWFADRLASLAQQKCGNSWRSCTALGALSAFVLFQLLSGWLIYGAMEYRYMGAAYSLGVFFFPIVAATLRGKWIAAIVASIFVFGSTYASLPWGLPHVI